MVGTKYFYQNEKEALQLEKDRMMLQKVKFINSIIDREEIYLQNFVKLKKNNNNEMIEQKTSLNTLL